MLLLVGSGLLLRSFERMQDTPIGFQADHLFVADLPLSQTAYARPEQRYGFYDRLVDRAHTLPGVRAAAAASYLPVSGGGSIIHFNITGHPPKSPHEYVAAGYCAVTANYFETLGVPLLQGRYLSRSDTDHSPSVVVVNSTLAQNLFPQRKSARSTHSAWRDTRERRPTMEIVGVVSNVTQGLGLEPNAEMFVPYKQGDQLLPVFQLSLVMRTAADPHQETTALRSAVGEIDPKQPIVEDSNDGRQHGRNRRAAAVSNVAHRDFRARWRFCLRRSAVYGVMSYSVTQRTDEIGIRVTLGAQPNDVFRTVVGEGLRFALLGVAIGVAAGLALTRLLASFLYGISAYDPAKFIAVACSAIGVLLPHLFRAGAASHGSTRSSPSATSSGTSGSAGFQPAFFPRGLAPHETFQRILRFYE